MSASLRASLQAVLFLLLACTLAVMIAPGSVCRIPSRRAEGFLPPSWYQRSPDGMRYVLGTDYLGRPFVPVLVQALSGTVRIALPARRSCCRVSPRRNHSRLDALARLEALVAAGNLGVMAVPEAAVLITLATAWPRTAPAVHVNASMVAVLVAFAVPTGARLIAERVRAVGRAGFVAASRAYGASYAYTFRHDIWPHLVEDVAWIVASVLPRFVAIEVGLAYLGVEYRDFEGLGRTLDQELQQPERRHRGLSDAGHDRGHPVGGAPAAVRVALAGCACRAGDRLMSRPTVLEVRGLCVRGPPARPFSMASTSRCAHGEVTALVGETGSGKTTVLNSVLGLLPPASRSARVRCGSRGTIESICSP